MFILEHPSQIKPFNLQHIHCAIGVFDGVHLGHQKLIRHVVQSAKEQGGKSVVITFDKHPYSVLNPSVNIPLLTLPLQKAALVEALGVDICILMKFNKSIASIPAETWIKETLWEDMHISAIHLGDDTFFGKDGKGNTDMLLQWSKQLGFKVIRSDMLRTDKIQISSTSIRNAIMDGNFSTAEKMLGRPYSILGSHIKGRGLGKEIGFHTINLDTQDQCLPPNGIYTVYVDKDMPAIANLGISPTFGFNKILPQQVAKYFITKGMDCALIPPDTIREGFPHRDKKPLLEVHMLSDKMPHDQNNIEVQFIEKLRDEIKFPTVEALTVQIKNDIKQAKKIFFSL